jgi:hypothetical protein
MYEFPRLNCIIIVVIEQFSWNSVWTSWHWLSALLCTFHFYGNWFWLYPWHLYGGMSHIVKVASKRALRNPKMHRVNLVSMTTLSTEIHLGDSINQTTESHIVLILCRSSHRAVLGPPFVNGVVCWFCSRSSHRVGVGTCCLDIQDRSELGGGGGEFLCW